MRLLMKIRVHLASKTFTKSSKDLPIGKKIFDHPAFSVGRGEGVRSEEHIQPIESDELPNASSERWEDNDLQRAHKRIKYYFDLWPEIVVDLEFLSPEDGEKALAEIAKGLEASKILDDGWRN